MPISKQINHRDLRCIPKAALSVPHLMPKIPVHTSKMPRCQAKKARCPSGFRYIRIQKRSKTFITAKLRSHPRTKIRELEHVEIKWMDNCNNWNLKYLLTTRYFMSLDLHKRMSKTNLHGNNHPAFQSYEDQ